MLKRLGEDIGSYVYITSIVLIIVGVIGHNDACFLIGGSAFTLMIGYTTRLIDADIKDAHTKAEAEAYAIKKNADMKADLLAQAYADGKIKDEDIEFLIRSLADANSPVAKAVQQREYIPVQPIKTIEVESKPIIHEEPIVTVDIQEADSQENNSNEDIQEISYVVDNGRFLFPYNGNNMAFSPRDVIKGEALHKDFDDSFGYYKNADAVFYIYPANRKIVAVSI